VLKDGATVLICGLGDLGGWALEFLARSPGVARIVTMRRSSPPGPTAASLAALGAVFQDRLVRCEHVTGDVTDVESTARLLRETDPDVILTAATMRSPRGLMHADIAPDVRAILRRATFGMWLPSHLLPVTRLTQAAMEAGCDAPIVNIAFPDVVNPAVWARLGQGPTAGAGNGEVSAATLEHHLAIANGVGLDEVEVAVVASHAFFTHGAEVPYWARARVRGQDVSGTIDVPGILAGHPEPIDWRRTSTFSIFAASAVKNVLGLIDPQPRRVHVTAPNGLPGSYPAMISRTGIELALPDEITYEEAIGIAEAGNAHDGIAAIEDDGTVVYTDATASAMQELGYDGARVRFEELEDRVDELNRLFARITR
jgi:hypothetical protein